MGTGASGESSNYKRRYREKNPDAQKLSDANEKQEIRNYRELANARSRQWRERNRDKIIAVRAALGISADKSPSLD
jgi:arsenate reductase-like glutaredoxin family protein